MVGQLARLGLTAAAFLIVSSGLLLLVFLQPSSAEFIITLLTCGLGVFLALFSTLVVLIERKRK